MPIKPLEGLKKATSIGPDPFAGPQPSPADLSATQWQQEHVPAWRRALGDAAVNTSEAISGLLGFGQETKANQAGQLLAAGMPLGAGIKGMYSRVARAVEGFPAKINANRALNQVRSQAAPAEIEWRKLDEFLKGQQGQAVTKEEIQQHLAQHPLDLQVTKRGDYQGTDMADHSPQWDNYQLDKGRSSSNYREDLIKLAPPPQVTSASGVTGDPLEIAGRRGYGADNSDLGLFVPDHHYPDDPNLVVAVRHNERRLPPMEGTGKNIYGMGLNDVENTYRRAAMQAPPQQEATAPVGPKGRMIENVQSQWEQKGAHAGYTTGQTANTTPVSTDEARARLHELTNHMREQYGHYLDPEDLQHLDPDDLPGYIVNRLHQNANDETWEIRTTNGLHQVHGTEEYAHEFANRFQGQVMRQLRQPDPEAQQAAELLQGARVRYDNELDALNRQSGAVPDMPFKGISTPPTLAMKQQLLDIAHNHPDTQWIGVAPYSELAARGERMTKKGPNGTLVDNPDFQDKMLPGILEKLLGHAGGPPVPAKDAMWIRAQPTPLGLPKEKFQPLGGSEVGRVRDYHQGVASVWPRYNALSEDSNANRAGKLADLLEASPHNQLKAPTIGLTPDMLAAIRKKGFPLLSAAALAGLQQAQPSQEGGH